jgi:hypothetical protein
MFLFLHSITETNSSLIPLIKSLFDLNHDTYSDKFLLDTFTIQIPGYDSADSNNEYKEIERRIVEFEQSNLATQQKLAQELIFCKNQTAVSALKEERLNLVGNEIGAGIAFEFATKNASLVSSIASLNCGYKFSGVNNYIRNFHIKRIIKKKPFQLQSFISKSKSIEDKKLASILLENVDRKGFLSYWEIMKNYNFKNYFNRLSISEQIAFAKIPILCIISRTKPLVSKSQIIEFGKLINPNNNFVNNKHTFITFDEDNKSHFYFNVVENLDLNILGTKNLVQITNNLKEFLQN